MFRLIGIFTVSIALSTLMIFVDTKTGNNFVADFLVNQSLQLMGVLLGLNLATATTLMVGLTNIEFTLKRRIFEPTIQEMKENILFMVFAFVVDMLLLMAIEQKFLNVEYGKLLSLTIFLIYLFAFYEMTIAVFSLEVKKREILTKKS